MKCKLYGKKTDGSLVNNIQDKLNDHRSPEQISGRITIDKPDKKIAFSSIYNWLYNGVLNKCSVELLHRKGKSLNPKETRGKFNIGKTIKQCPKEVRKRTTVGHWELDTVVSSRCKSKACLSTLLKGRYCQLKSE